MRKRLFELHLPNLTLVQADLNEIARNSLGLCGGDILNVCLNAIYAGSTSQNPAEWRITGAILNAQIAKVKASKSNHEGRNAQRPIGFNAQTVESE